MLLAMLFVSQLVLRWVLGVASTVQMLHCVALVALFVPGLWFLVRGHLETHINLLALVCVSQCLVFFPAEVSRHFFVLCLFSMVWFAILAMKPYQKAIAFVVFPLLVAVKGGYEFWLGSRQQLTRSTWEETIFTLLVFAASMPMVNVLMGIMGREIRHTEVLLDANKHWKTEAGTDRLTGVWNRRTFEQLARRETGEAQRTERPLALAILDIDHFKEVNDHFGHQAGDQALVGLVRALSPVLRQGDSLIRWGGDEFVLLLPGAGPQEAPGLAEKLRLAILCDDQLRQWNLGISVGIAIWRPQEPMPQLLARADRLLYRAKEQGRNQICAEDEACR